MALTVITGLPRCRRLRPVIKPNIVIAVCGSCLGVAVFKERDITDLLIERSLLVIEYGIGQLGTILDNIQGPRPHPYRRHRPWR